MRDIPNKLEAVGHEMRQARAGEQAAPFPAGVVELLAEQEHERGMRLKLAQGWSYGADDNRAARRHRDLMPWRDLPAEQRVKRSGPDEASRVASEALPDKEKEKDRTLMRELTRILAAHGYRVTKAHAAPVPKPRTRSPRPTRKPRTRPAR